MSQRTITQVLKAGFEQVAPGLYIKRPLPTAEVKHFDPFLMLDHFGPMKIKPGETNQVPPHPHKGFCPVTLLFSGQVRHRDSLGHDMLLQSGDIGWMTAGNGIVHEETFTHMAEDPERMVHGIQLWVNLPTAYKRVAPSYQHIKASQIPIINHGDYELRLLTGSIEGRQSPLDTYTPITLIEVTGKAGSRIKFSVPKAMIGAVYNLTGQAQLGNITWKENELALLDTGDELEYTLRENSHQLILLGEPHHQRIYSYGPYVMNNMREVIDAIQEYEQGEFGFIP